MRSKIFNVKALNYYRNNLLLCVFRKYCSSLQKVVIFLILWQFFTLFWSIILLERTEIRDLWKYVSSLNNCVLKLYNVLIQDCFKNLTVSVKRNLISVCGFKYCVYYYVNLQKQCLFLQKLYRPQS